MKHGRPVAALYERLPRRSQTAATKHKVRPRCRAAQTSRSSPRDERNNGAVRASLPTQRRRDTLPDAIAESVVAEASRYLNAELPGDFPERLAARAHYLYPRHKHFHKMLNRPGNRGRHNLCVYMRHWTASWLKRERRPLFKRLPWEYALGRRLPSQTAKRQF